MLSTLDQDQGDHR